MILNLLLFILYSIILYLNGVVVVYTRQIKQNGIQFLNPETIHKLSTLNTTPTILLSKNNKNPPQK